MILCCGESLIDMLPRDTTAGEAAFAPYAGGAVFNTAIALGRLGAPSGFLSGISTDLFGEVLIEALSASKVHSGFAIRSDRPTTLAFVKLVDGQASYAFYDENTAGRMITPEDLPELGDGISALFFGGISLVSEPCAKTYETLMLREASSRVNMIDPNVRPGFITDEAAYRARIERMLAAADIVKLSDEDLAWFSGDKDPREFALGLLQNGPSLICITEGSSGARGITRDIEVFAPATKVEVVDTVGAGDTFNAGVLASLHEAGVLTKQGIRGLGKEALFNALALGTGAAAITVSRAGANPPWKGEF